MLTKNKLEIIKHFFEQEFNSSDYLEYFKKHLQQSTGVDQGYEDIITQIDHMQTQLTKSKTELTYEKRVRKCGSIKEAVSIREAARILEVYPKKIELLIKEGKIKTIKIKNNNRPKYSSVMDYKHNATPQFLLLNSHKTNTETPFGSFFGKEDEEMEERIPLSEIKRYMISWLKNGGKI